MGVRKEEVASSAVGGKRFVTIYLSYFPGRGSEIQYTLPVLEGLADEFGPECFEAACRKAKRSMSEFVGIGEIADRLRTPPDPDQDDEPYYGLCDYHWKSIAQTGRKELEGIKHKAIGSGVKS